MVRRATEDTIWKAWKRRGLRRTGFFKYPRRWRRRVAHMEPVTMSETRMTVKEGCGLFCAASRRLFPLKSIGTNSVCQRQLLASNESLHCPCEWDSRLVVPLAWRPAVAPEVWPLPPFTGCQGLCWGLYIHYLQVREQCPSPYWPPKDKETRSKAWITLLLVMKLTQEQGEFGLHNCAVSVQHCSPL